MPKSSPKKIAMIGAGSVVFCKTLISDILATPALQDSEFALMSPTETKLRRMEAFVRRMINDNKFPAKVWATTNRRDAIKDADYVVVMIQVGGQDAFGMDYEIPLKYGVDQCIGDTLGPGGIFKALRTGPAWLEILRDAERECPGAMVMNYTNPMSLLTLAAIRATSMDVVGLCHSIQGTSEQLAGYLEVPLEELRFRAAGINHNSWFVELERDGKDLYPELRRRM